MIEKFKNDGYIHAQEILSVNTSEDLFRSMYDEGVKIGMRVVWLLIQERQKKNVCIYCGTKPCECDQTCES